MPFFTSSSGICLSHKNDDFDKCERVMTLLLVLSVSLLFSTLGQRGRCEDIAACDPNDVACIEAADDSEWVTVILIALFSMIFNAVMKTASKCSCCKGPSIPKWINSCSEALGKVVICSSALLSLILFLAASSILNKIEDPACRSGAFATVAYAQLTAWLTDPLTAVIFFARAWANEKKEHEAYLKRIVEVVPAFADASSNALHMITSTCREQEWKMDKDEQHVDKFVSYWNGFVSDKGNADVTYASIWSFRLYCQNRTEQQPKSLVRAASQAASSVKLEI